MIAVAATAASGYTTPTAITTAAIHTALAGITTVRCTVILAAAGMIAATSHSSITPLLHE